jgi:hypothetical protein
MTMDPFANTTGPPASEPCASFLHGVSVEIPLNLNGQCQICGNLLYKFTLLDGARLSLTVVSLSFSGDL